MWLEWSIPIAMGTILSVTALVRAGRCINAWRCQRELKAWQPGRVVQRFSGFDPELRARTAEKRKRGAELSKAAMRVHSSSLETAEHRKLKVVGR